MQFPVLLLSDDLQERN